MWGWPIVVDDGFERAEWLQHLLVCRHLRNAGNVDRSCGNENYEIQDRGQGNTWARA